MPLTCVMLVLCEDGAVELTADPQGVADYLQCNVETIHRRIRRGEYQAYRVGRRWALPVTQFADMNVQRLLQAVPA